MTTTDPMNAAFANWASFQKNLMEEHLRGIQKMKTGFDMSRDWEAKVSQTPHQLVYEEGKVRLLHYKSQTEKTHPIPLLIVFSLINRSYILDLKKGKSIVEKMVQAGFDVYLIDWGVTGPADQFLTLDDYINRTMYRVVEYVKEHADVEEISMLGYCMGGTMSGIFASLYPESVRNLILMAAPFDFTEKKGLLNLWADKKHFNVDKLVDAMGNIPPWFLQSSFTMLKPMQNMVDKYVKFYENMENEKYVDDFLTMEYWLNDNIPLSGQVYKQFVEDCFHDNLLIQNKMTVGKHRIDLSNITCPVLSIVAEQDHLVPPCSSEPIHEVISSKDTEIMAFPSGHIGLSVSSRAMKTLWPEVAAWLAERSQETAETPVPEVKAVKATPKASKKKPSPKTKK